jgi:hypothetical protein
MVNKLRSESNGEKVASDVFAIDTVLISLSNNEGSHNETHIDLGAWGENYKLYSYDGFAYAINENYILYLTYPQVKSLNKDEKKETLQYRFGEEGSRDKRKPRYGDVCLYFGRVVASKMNKAGKPSFSSAKVSEEAKNNLLEQDNLYCISSASGAIAYVEEKHLDIVSEALQMKSPRGI